MKEPDLMIRPLSTKTDLPIDNTTSLRPSLLDDLKPTTVLDELKPTNVVDELKIQDPDYIPLVQLDHQSASN